MSLIIHHLLYFISISKPKNIWLFFYVSLSISFSSTIVSPPWIDCTYFAQDLKGGWYFSIQISCLHSRKKILLLQTTIQLFFNNCLRSIEFWSDSFIYLMKKDSFVILLELIRAYLVSCCDLTKKTKMNL